MGILEQLFGGNVEYSYPDYMSNLRRFSMGQQQPSALAAIAPSQSPMPQSPVTQSPQVSEDPYKPDTPYNGLERFFLGLGGQGEAVKKDKERFALESLGPAALRGDKSALIKLAATNPQGAALLMQMVDKPEYKIVDDQLVEISPGQPPKFINSPTGGKPKTEGLPVGQMWATDAQGNRVAVPIPGAETKETREDKEKLTAKSEFDSVLGELQGLYDDLREKGAIVDTEKSALSNFGARIAGTEGVKAPFTDTTIIPGGQSFGRALGTEEQSIRNKIKQKIPVLMSKIKKATGMTGTELNSNVELMFWLQSLGGLQNDYQSNSEIIKSLSEQYGAGKLAGEKKEKPSGKKRVKFSDL